MRETKDPGARAAGETAQSLQREAANAMRSGDGRRAIALLTQVVGTQDADAGVYLQLAAAYRSIGDVPRALETATASVQLAPRNFVALLMLASLYDALGAPDHAVRTYCVALNHAPAERLRLPDILRHQIEGAEQRIADNGAWEQSLASPSDDTLSRAMSGDEALRIAGFRANILANAKAGPERISAFVIPDLPSRPFFVPDEFAGVAALAAHTDVILGEFRNLIAVRFPRLVGYLGTDGPRRGAAISAAEAGKWSMIPLIRNGLRVDDHADLCPQTMRLHAATDGPPIGSISPSLYFSILEPGTHIPPHTGICNARLIVHWPLMVPPDCGIRVADETRRWETGKALIFDDMMEHEAWNRSDEMRVVLIADVWNPSLSSSERNAVTAMMAGMPA